MRDNPKNLDELLSTINYENLFRKREIKAEEVLSHYLNQSRSITNWREAEECLTIFAFKIIFDFLNISEHYNKFKSLALNLTESYITAKYPLHTAYNMILTGVDGGLYQVLKDIKDEMLKRNYEIAINSYVDAFLYEKKLEERINIAREYLQKYGDLLPNNYKKDSVWLGAILDKVLKEHPKMMKRLRSLG